MPDHSNIAGSVGDSKTLATHPWNSTHVIMSEKDRREAGITPVSLIRTYSDLSLKDLPANDNLRQAFIRFSVGTEDVRDIIEDLDQALAKLPENIVNIHDEKLEAKVTAAANGIMDTYGGGNGDVDFIDADISLSKSNVPLGRQTAVGNW